jgi:ATP-dependent helicase YprA (DUF1998 family)
MEFEQTAEYKARAQSMVNMVQNVLHKRLREWQLRAAMALASGYDVVCTAATGSGKTLAFQAPILHDQRHGVAIVISPLVALMNDQVSPSALPKLCLV